MGLYLLLGGSLTILDFAGFLVIATKLTEPALTLVSSISALRGMALSGERLDRVMTTPDPSGTDEIDHGDSYAFDRVYSKWFMSNIQKELTPKEDDRFVDFLL